MLSWKIPHCEWCTLGDGSKIQQKYKKMLILLHSYLCPSSWTIGEEISSAICWQDFFSCIFRNPPHSVRGQPELGIPRANQILWYLSRETNQAHCSSPCTRQGTSKGESLGQSRPELISPCIVNLALCQSHSVSPCVNLTKCQSHTVSISPWVNLKEILSHEFNCHLYVNKGQTKTVASTLAMTKTLLLCKESDYFWDSVGSNKASLTVVSS